MEQFELRKHAGIVLVGIKKMISKILAINVILYFCDTPAM